ncbi:MAG: GDSL-type esterase/lipase family protein, partial [Geminicoccaceae bacterium]
TVLSVGDQVVVGSGADEPTDETPGEETPGAQPTDETPGDETPSDDQPADENPGAGDLLVIQGTAGDDDLDGTDAAERIIALNGTNRIRAGGGDDIVEPGQARDYISLGDGADWVIGDMLEVRKDRIYDFSTEDRVLIEDQTFFTSDIRVQDRGERTRFHLDVNRDGLEDGYLELEGDFSSLTLVAERTDQGTVLRLDSFAEAAADPGPAITPRPEGQDSGGGYDLIVVGDSLTSPTFFMMQPGEAFTAELQTALDARGYAVNVIDRQTVQGNTTADGLRELRAYLDDNPAPEAALVELGANDVLNDWDPADTEANLRSIIEELMAQGTKVMLAGISSDVISPTSSGLDPSKHAAFDQIFANLASEYDIPLYADYLAGVQGSDDLTFDGLHPTAAGVDLIVDSMIGDITAFLDGAGAPLQVAAESMSTAETFAFIANDPVASVVLEDVNLGSG